MNLNNDDTYIIVEFHPKQNKIHDKSIIDQFYLQKRSVMQVKESYFQEELIDCDFLLLIQRPFHLFFF